MQRIRKPRNIVVCQTWTPAMMRRHAKALMRMASYVEAKRKK